MFSPYYAAARRRGGADPRNHCAVNVCLYGPRARWTMTERGAGALVSDATMLCIGPSLLAWTDDMLRIRLDEVAVPLPVRLRGEVRFYPAILPGRRFALDAPGRHIWTPLAPRGRVEVVLDRPALRWSGIGYCDANHGAAPLEQDFARWDWSCARLSDGAAVLYHVEPRADAPRTLALRFAAQGGCESFPPPPRTTLPATRWRIARTTHGPARIARVLEDTPFYARTLLRTHLLGEAATAMHETLSLDRFRRSWVQALLPFRMPRRR